MEASCPTPPSSLSTTQSPNFSENCDFPEKKHTKTIQISHILWPILGLSTVIFSLVLLGQELHSISFEAILSCIQALSLENWLFALGGMILAYGALAFYDHIALMHLKKQVPWSAVIMTSFTAYALSHNIGMSMFSGALIRWRAYGSMGLTLSEVGVFAALTSFTFVLGVASLMGVLCLYDPQSIADLFHVTPLTIQILGVVAWSLIALYTFASWKNFKPLKIKSFSFYYPSFSVVLRQMIIAPIEVLGAASIVYFAIPGAFNPGFVPVVTAFVASFCTALLSHAPGGLGVLEFTFIKIMPSVPVAHLLTALLIFRLLYLIIPLFLGMIAVIIFEWKYLKPFLMRSGKMFTFCALYCQMCCLYR
jgi:uncharacterized membrane protein YbhN (UPF0104 family)